MTKFQFLLVASLITSVVCLLVGSRDGNALDAIFPIALIIALASVCNRYISETVWNKVAIWANTITGKRIFRVKIKRLRLPPSKLNRLS
jgi:hypothetical protein